MMCTSVMVSRVARVRLRHVCSGNASPCSRVASAGLVRSRCFATSVSASSFGRSLVFQRQHWCALGTPRSPAQSPPLLTVAARGVATQKLKRPKGLVSKALQISPPPKLPKAGKEHYLKVLRANGQAAAKQIVNAGKAPHAATPGPWELTSEEKNLLMARYLPEEREEPQMLRRRVHKQVWRLMRKRDWKRLDGCFEQLRSRQVTFDEITYNMEIFAVLCNPRRDKEEALEALQRMAAEGKFNPVLLRLHSGFLDSYFDLCKVDAAPNPVNLGKLAMTFWHISKNFKRHRIKQLRAKLARAAGEQRRRLQEAADAGELLEEGSEDELSDDGDDEKRRKRLLGVRFPAKGPPKLRGIYRGSGVPRQRRLRWKL